MLEGAAGGVFEHGVQGGDVLFGVIEGCPAGAGLTGDGVVFDMTPAAGCASLDTRLQLHVETEFVFLCLVCG